MKVDQLFEATVLDKLKMIFMTGDLTKSSSQLPVVIKTPQAIKGEVPAIDQSKRNTLKRSVSSIASTLSRTSSSMTPLNALVKLLELDPSIKPYTIERVDGEFKIDGMWDITDEEVEECRGHEATLKRWQELATTAMRSKKFDDILVVTDATTGELELFGAETYNGWFVDYEGQLDLNQFTAADRKIFGEYNVFIDENWKKLSHKAQDVLTKFALETIEYIWAKCDVVRTLLPLIKPNQTQAEKRADRPQVEKRAADILSKKYSKVVKADGWYMCNDTFREHTTTKHYKFTFFIDQSEVTVMTNHNKLTLDVKTFDDVEEAVKFIDNYAKKHGGLKL